MALRVIGLGVGRTGTYSMKAALEQLGFGPCHHMEDVKATSVEDVALWRGLTEGRGDIEAAYEGYNSAVDWPTAAFADELFGRFPDAKFIVTARDADKWYASFSQTIYPLILPDSNAPPEKLPFIEMVRALLLKTGFAIPSSRDEMIAAYNRHIEHVRSTIPADRLLICDVTQGWEPLCRFLGVPEPAMDFPRSNSKKEFWESIETGARPSLH